MGNTISENKVATAAVIATGVLGITFWAYKQYKQEQPEVPPQSGLPSSQKKASTQEQIQKLRSEIDVANPTLQDIKRLFTLLANHVRSKTLQFSEKFKEERRKRFPKERRYAEIGDYFKFTNQGLANLQNKIVQLQGEQNQLMNTVGINQAKFGQYATQLGQFMQQLVFGNVNIPLEDLKKSLQLKTEYLEVHGQKLVTALIQLSASLSLQEKQNIPLFLNVIISDETFQHEPSLDKQEFDLAYEKYKNEIAPELIKLQKVVMPIMGRLQAALIGGDDMGGMGGYGGFGSGPDMFQGGQGFGGYDQMGGMGGMNEQMMMQQIEQLRVADPQAYEQLMMMMQAQMGR